MTRRGAILALWTACLIWGAAFPLTKLALRDASPMAFTAARFLVASLLLLPALGSIRTSEWRAGALLGGLLALGFATQTIGLGFTTASRSGFLTSLYIPFTPLILLLVQRSLPDRDALIGLAVAMGGMILLTRPDTGTALNRGDLLTVVCALAFAAHLVATGAAARRHPVERLMMAQIVVAAGCTTLLTPLVETTRLHWTPLLTGMVAYEAVLASLVAIRLQLAAQQVLAPTYAALVFSLEPVIAAGTSMVLAGDRLGPGQWAGGGLIMVGSLWPELHARLRTHLVTRS